MIGPTYYASHYLHRDVPGIENYFRLTCDVHDDVITLANVDAELRTTKIILSSLVFCLNGKVIGMIYSSSV